MAKNSRPTLYRFYGDISGDIKNGDISLGVILFNEKFRKGFLSQFYEKFPNLRSFEKKAATLNEEKLNMERFGKEYEDYVKKVSRYFLIKS